MRIEHVAMWTADLERMADFYARYFAAEAGPRYENPVRGFASRFLRFADGARLELMQTRTLDPIEMPAGAERCGLTHLAIEVGDEGTVDALTARLRNDGHAVLDGPRRTGDGYYESVVCDPDGNRIELAAVRAGGDR